MKLTYKAILEETTKSIAVAGTVVQVRGQDAVRRVVHHIDFCCDVMKSQWRSENLFWFAGEYGWGQPKVSLLEKSPGYYGDIETTEHEIDFCPSCGEKIECVQGPRVRLVEKVTEVQKTVTERKVEHEEVPE